MSDYIDEVFGPKGLFANSYPGYEQRDGQVALARVIDQAMATNQHALCEAPCGTGKGIAYSVPAVYHAITTGKRVVIATANIALQEQLVEKDLPSLQAVLPWSFTYTLLKGRNNYLCLDRRELAQKETFPAHLSSEIISLNRWADEQTLSGDKSELDFVPAPLSWSRYSVSSSECKRKECGYYKDCFYERAKRAAFDSNIIVTNYHLLFAHLQTRRRFGQDLVLPKIDLLVLDEAHEMADIARDFFGFSVSKRTVDRLGNAASDMYQQTLGQRIFTESNVVFGELKRRSQGEADKIRLKTPLLSAGKLIEGLRELGQIAADVLENPSVLQGRGSDDILGVARQAEYANDVADAIEEAATLDDKNKVYTIELDHKERPKLASKLISVAALLNTDLFKGIPSVSLVSATMTTRGTFNFMRREVGMPKDSLEIIAPSPFDFKKQALLVVPKGLPDVNSDGYPLAVAKVMQQVIDICEGRTLCLFTSYRNLNIAYEHIAKQCRGRYRVLKQGDLPRTALAAIFKEDRHSVLLGTDSFWTGIDVPGEALTAVVIDKFPFQNMSDPVIDAIKEHDKDNWFFQHYLPRAVIKLRQGAGRLIRARSDIGVAVIPDPRGYSKNYGEDFLDSLSFTEVTESLADISRFLKGPGAPVTPRGRAPVKVAAAVPRAPALVPVAPLPPARDLMASPIAARLLAMGPAPAALVAAPLSESPIAAKLRLLKESK